MTQDTYRYEFAPGAPIEEIEASLLLALMGVESLHGAVRTRLDAAHYFDADERTCVIDASTRVGVDLNKLFAGFLSREFGPDAFRVERQLGPKPPIAAAA